LGRQELHAEILDDVEGALWHYAMLDAFRVAEMPPLTRIVIGVDPNASNHEHSDEMGIIAAGIGLVDGKTHGYVIGDASMRGTPMERGKAVISEYHKHTANAIVPEVNQGGDMVEYLIQSVVTRGLKPKIIPVHASRGKFTRAEPVASLYEQGLIHHLGAFPLLEDELCSWVPGEDSPNRLDALVHAFTELFHLREKPPAATGTRTPQINIRSRFGQGR
jgi:phage terminase large subunit-like protein